MEIECLCPKCQHLNTFQSLEIPCSQCQSLLIQHPTDVFLKNRTLNQCPICGASHLYRQKDFNRKIGILLLLIGIGLSYYTYGISLLVVTLFDFLLYRWVPEIGICYSCQSVFRQSEKIANLETFDLELYDYYRNLPTRTSNNPQTI